MKTNHRRGFKQEEGNWAGKGAKPGPRVLPNGRAKPHPGYGESRVDAEDKIISASASNVDGRDSCKGKHGYAKNRKGAKKFVHSRMRRQERDAIKKAMKIQPEE